jgi:FAD/FMN-containing dehydrogenase
MSSGQITSSTAEGFAAEGFAGTLLHPGQDGYDVARTLFNAMVDRAPSVIARCSSAADVAAIVRAARRDGLDFTVRAGGHGVLGTAVADDAVCIDLRGLKRIVVDPRGRTARVGAGVVWGELDAATQAHGLAVTGGRVSTTGVAGLTLGSGSGWLERSFGYTCDSLLSAEVVTADGRVVTASDRENPGLFWGLHGGGGNFGIVTEFHFRLHPVGPSVVGGLLLYPAGQAGEVARFYRDAMAEAPDGLGGGLAFLTAPPADFVPAALWGSPVVAILCCYAGPIDEGEAAVRELRQFGPPAADLIRPMPYVDVQRILDDANQTGHHNYWSADFLGELPDEAVDTLVEHAARPVSPLTQIVVVPGGGAVSRVPKSATALGDRTAPWNVHYLSMWADPADTDRNVAYTRALSAAMKPWASGRVYLNFIGDEGHGRVVAAFGTENYSRLAALKKTWDPTNVFRHNQNIPPAD